MNEDGILFFRKDENDWVKKMQGLWSGRCNFM